MRIMVLVLLLSAGSVAAQAPATADMAAQREADRLRTIALNQAARAESARRGDHAADAAGAARADYAAQRRDYEEALAENHRARARAADAARDYAAARADYAREMAEWRARSSPDSR